MMMMFWQRNMKEKGAKEASIEHFRELSFQYLSPSRSESGNVTALTGDIVNLQEEIENIVGKSDSPRKDDNNALGHYKEEITKLTKEIESLEEEETRARQTLYDINVGASKLFHLLECDLKPVHGLVGQYSCKSEVTNSSLPTFLSVIEQKVEEICKLKEKLETKSDNVTPRQDQNQNESGIDGQTDTTPSSITKAKPVIPHIVHPVDEDGNEPTTHGDLLSSLRARRSDSFDS
ncbi:hypothetical protein Avbf_07897 [Armadillidium vulgare]|nr:hypothetical protein Avbf_07897 [Armadillidium vulgare]